MIQRHLSCFSGVLVCSGIEKPITEINHCLSVISPILMTDAALSILDRSKTYLCTWSIFQET